ncbi:hypothetical protein [Aureimonas populi]|uniref:Uncharacterized protein n=1 Tax=Aureimonas populi TaxID=1701758 RepID=A0ABW5CK64_9HYPH|nr:hypothetical protein [Aureimonas populi]
MSLAWANVGKGEVLHLIARVMPPCVLPAAFLLNWSEDLHEKCIKLRAVGLCDPGKAGLTG